MLIKHPDLVDRRILKGEVIPHEEKMMSIFEDYTEWIAKGKFRPSVELGKKVSITTDRFDLIVMSVCAYNLKKIGKKILENQVKELSKKKAA